MPRQTKTGSSRRKGDEYQDLTALQLILEAYIDTNISDFKVFIEYEEAKSFDDIFIVTPNCVDAYQVKYAVSENAVYIADDFTNKDSSVFMEKFAKSWKSLEARYRDTPLTLHLRSNRALDAQLAEIVTNNGFFKEEFCENRYKKEKRELRATILASTGLTENEFKQFLRSFHFDLRHRSWKKLEEYIKADLLDHRLGISDRRVFSDLKQLVERYAIEIADPIIPKIIDEFLRKTQGRYLLPQLFPVDKERFVKSPTFNEQLNERLSTANAEYVVITGPPGSGKSTALTEYCDAIEANASDCFIVVRYYCFVRVQDNLQRLRVEAKSLRVNLLTELKRRFPGVLDERQFDFSETHFHEVLKAIGDYCEQQKKKLIVLLDGLDHAERNDEVCESVITALPKELPQGVVFLIGTQELNRWKPIALKEGLEKRHIKMPLFSWDETRTYIVDCCGLDVPDETIQKIFQKSAGLPLYLRYLAELLSSSDNPNRAIDTIPEVVEGDIRTYYETLWGAFDAEDRTDAKYLSSVLANLRFEAHENELIEFQKGVLDASRFEKAYRQVRHLLRTSDSLVSIFHDSFRIFVLDRTSPAVQPKIVAGILQCLKQEELESTRWFKHACRYALEADDFDYILSKINRNFVDAALLRFRPEEEITDGIECAIEAAGKTSNLVALSRLGSLKYRTYERLENISKPILAEVLLNEGRIDQVVDSIYAEESKTIIANNAYSLQVILKLVELDRSDLGEKLFCSFLKTFHGSDDPDSIVMLARCCALFKKRPAKVMQWLANITLERDILKSEPEELSVQYAPHLAAYLDCLVNSNQDNAWKRLKKINHLFSNQLIRQLVTRAVANWRTIEELRFEVEEYVTKHANDTNVELAFYAAKAGLSIAFVNRLAGRFDFPPKTATAETPKHELKSHILRFAYWTAILGYEQNVIIVRQLCSQVRASKAVWACTQAHLLKVGEILGSHFCFLQEENPQSCKEFSPAGGWGIFSPFSAHQGVSHPVARAIE